MWNWRSPLLSPLEAWLCPGICPILPNSDRGCSCGECMSHYLGLSHVKEFRRTAGVYSTFEGGRIDSATKPLTCI